MRTEYKTERSLVIGLLLALFLKYMLYGFQYYPILDDAIQYGCYPLYPNIVNDIFLHVGTIATRPLAGLLDPLLWGRMWNCMWLALLLITLLHFCSFLLLDQILQYNGIKASPLLYLLFLLFPTASEATYWISASSRLVVGMFLALLSIWLLCRYFHGGKRLLLILSVPTLLASFCLYEQVMVFGFCAYLLVVVLQRPPKRRWQVVIPAGCAAAVLIYYRLASGIGQMANRAAGFSFGNLFANIIPFCKQMAEIWGVNSAKLLFVGSYEGMVTLLNRGMLLAIAFVGLAAICALQIGRTPYPRDARPNWWLCLIGAGLFLAPFAPNLLVEEVWLTHRSIFPSLIGLGLMAEPLVSKFLRHRAVRTPVFMVLTLLFLFSNVNEYRIYRETSLYDRQIVTQLAQQLDDAVRTGQKQLAVISGEPYHIPQPAYYKDHVKSVTYADWSLTGALRAECKNVEIPTVLLLQAEDGLVDTSQLNNQQIFSITDSGDVIELSYDDGKLRLKQQPSA